VRSRASRPTPVRSNACRTVPLMLRRLNPPPSAASSTCISARVACDKAGRPARQAGTRPAGRSSPDGRADQSWGLAGMV
jgi:hypothetical protein